MVYRILVPNDKKEIVKIRFAYDNIKFDIYKDYLIIAKKYKKKAIKILDELLDSYFMAEIINEKPWIGRTKRNE